MSLSSKLCVGLACTVSFGIIVFVHYKQWSDKQKLQEGVIRDIERQQKKKIENIYWLQQQTEIANLFKKQDTKDDPVRVQLLDDSKKSS